MESIDVSAAQAGTLVIGGDLAVNRLGFGSMRLTGPGIWGEPADRDEAKAVLRRAVELGTNFIDTADSYGPHVSENLIAEALYPYPDDLVIATKGGLERTGPDRWPSNHFVPHHRLPGMDQGQPRNAGRLVVPCHSNQAYGGGARAARGHSRAA